MDSKTSHEQPSTHLVFDKNSTINTNILVDGQIRYTISTTDRELMQTKISDATTQQELATIRRRSILPNKISFANRQGGKEQKLNSVLKDHKLSDGFPVHLIRTEQGDFYWKIHPVYRLAFFSMSDPVHPVAYRESIETTFAIVIKQEFEGITDYIIPTFLVLERRLRTGEKSSDTADGINADNRTILGNYVTTGGGSR